MNKWLKGTLIASAAVTVAGAVLLGVGIALGGSPFFYYDTDGLHVKENTEETAKQDYVLESTKIGALSSLELDLHNAPQAQSPNFRSTAPSHNRCLLQCSPGQTDTPRLPPW